MTMLYIKGIIKQQSVAAKQKRYLFIILKKKKKTTHFVKWMHGFSMMLQ